MLYLHKCGLSCAIFIYPIKLLSNRYRVCYSGPSWETLIHIYQKPGSSHLISTTLYYFPVTQCSLLLPSVLIWWKLPLWNNSWSMQWVHKPTWFMNQVIYPGPAGIQCDSMGLGLGFDCVWKRGDKNGCVSLVWSNIEVSDCCGVLCTTTDAEMCTWSTALSLSCCQELMNGIADNKIWVSFLCDTILWYWPVTLMTDSVIIYVTHLNPLHCDPVCGTTSYNLECTSFFSAFYIFLHKAQIMWLSDSRKMCIEWYISSLFGNYVLISKKISYLI